MNTRLAAFLAAGAICCVLLPSLAASDDVDAQEQAALNAAVDRVAPAVVRIETIGGLQRASEMALGAGMTTGLVVDPAGYVVSSAFGFASKPESILVRLGDGTRRPAKLVATDHARMIVLLKIDADRPLPTCETAPTDEMRVGQWTIALGRTFESDRPSMAVGVLSALNRVWGRAIQTDAAVSPNNYGGPLLDIRGRVLGVLAPLAPDADNKMAGVEWYDSGIGFAIPMQHIEQVLPRLKRGEDLFPGRMGIGLKGTNRYTGEPLIGVCRPKGPADAAGLKPSDRIIAIDGRAIARAAELTEELGRRYAGDTVRVTVLRGQTRIDRDLKLAVPNP